MAESAFLGIDPTELSRADAHRLLLHCVAPRPIAFTSSLSVEAIPNLAPFSYFMAGGANPPSVVISPMTGRDGSHKDTLRNIRATGEYVINVVTYAMRERMNSASTEFPYGVPEWSQCGFTPLNSVRVKPSRVAESPLAIECKLHDIISHGNGPLSANYVIGEVVYFHMSKSVMRDGVLDARLVNYISRMGGDWYDCSDESSMFEMQRPPRADIAQQAL